MTRASLPLPHRHEHDDGWSSFRRGPLGREPLAAPHHAFSRARVRQTVSRRGPFLLGSLLWLLLLQEWDR